MVKRYDMEKEYSLDINIVPVEEHDGAFVRYDDYAELLEALRQLRDYVEDMHHVQYGHNWVDESHPMFLAQLAIAKALGETK
jgi:hypothetical protein